MDIHLPGHIVSALDTLDPRAKKSRLHVRGEGVAADVLSMDDRGFHLSIDAPHLRGAVAILDGARHVADCLIVAAESEGRFVRYEYKRKTHISETAPLDYVREVNAPVALIEG